MAWLLMFNSGIASAGKFLYEFNGTIQGSFLSVYDDAKADLLNVSRGTTNSFPFTLKLIIDTDDVPDVELDTSIIQNVLYHNALIGGVLDLNGVTFEFLKEPPSQGISILNYISENGLDQFRIQLSSDYSEDEGALFNIFTVPFNQTINGSLIENVSIALSGIGVLMSDQGFLSGMDIPVENGIFDPLPTLSSIGIVLYDSLGLLLTLTSTNDLSGDHTVSITPLPDTAQNIVLLDNSVHTVQTGFSERIYGSAYENTVIVQNEADATLLNFPGGNTVIFESGSELFSVYRSGATVFFQGPNKTKVSMPATNSFQSIVFNDQQFDLMIQSGTVKLGGQEINLTASSLEGF